MSLATNVLNLATRLSTEFKTIRTMLTGTSTGDFSTLTTASKNVLGAINELDAAVDAAASSGGATNLDQLTDVVLTAEVDGHMLRRVGGVYVNVDPTTLFEPAGAAEAMRQQILGAGVPAALDTLDELAAALGDDANFAASVTTSLAGKQPLDATLTALAGQTVAADQVIYSIGPDAFAVTALTPFARTLLDDATAAAARGTLSVPSQAELGDPETDFVATFNAGLLT